MELSHPRGRLAARRRILAVTVSSVVMLSACAEPADTIDVTILALAGPVCPVVTEPPDRACADRPVADAELVVVRDGRSVTSVRTDADGRTSLALPAGTYTIRPQPVSGLMGTPADVLVEVGGSAPTITLSYDTGIR